MTRRLTKKRKIASVAERESITCLVEPNTSEFDSFFQSLRNLYLNEQLCDLSFNCGGKLFPAHRIILASSNTFLSGLILSGMKESAQTVIDIDEDPNLFKYILDYIYGIRIDIRSENIIPLLGLSNRFSMIGLRNKLGDILINNLSIANCCSIFAAADAFNCDTVKQQAQDLLFRNFAIASKTADFLLLPQNLVEHILSSDDILDCDESLIFDVADRWIEHQPSLAQSNNSVVAYFTESPTASVPVSYSGSLASSSHRSSVFSHTPSQSAPLKIQTAATSSPMGRSPLDPSGVTSLLSHIRFPLMDSCLLSEVIKPHRLMQDPDRLPLLLEAFEHHALRAVGRPGIQNTRTKNRKKSCTFTESTLLNGHTDAVSALLVYQNWLISGSWDSTIKIWETNTWTCVSTLSDHAGAIRGLCVCNDRVISGSDDGILMVWTPGPWTCARSVVGSDDGALNAMVPCRGRLASAGDDGVIKLWNSTTWACEVTVHHTIYDEDGNESTARVGVMSMDVLDDKLISAGDDSIIRIWNTFSWTCEQAISVHNDEVWSVCVTPNGTLFSGSVDSTIKVWLPQIATNINANTNSGSSTVLNTDALQTAYSSSISHSSSVGSFHSASSIKGILPTDIAVTDQEQITTEWTCTQTIQVDEPVYALCYLDGFVVSAGSGSKISVWRSSGERGTGSRSGEDELVLHKTLDTAEVDVWSLAVCQGRLISGGMHGTIRELTVCYMYALGVIHDWLQKEGQKSSFHCDKNLTNDSLIRSCIY